MGGPLLLADPRPGPAELMRVSVHIRGSAANRLAGDRPSSISFRWSATLPGSVCLLGAALRTRGMLMTHARRPYGRHFALSVTGVIRPLAASVAAMTIVAAVAFIAQPASAARPPVAVPAADPTEAADQATAMRLAWKSRKPVEILGERTESSETFALPDGTLRSRQHASPIRVRRGAKWVPVKPDLKVVDGVVVPEATTLDVRFSNGGGGPLLTVVRDGRSLAMSWPSPFRKHKPVLSGSTATYREVLPGVDLRLSAYVDSFSEVLVVKTPTAADNPDLRALRFGLATQGVAVQSGADGFIKAVTPSGEPVFVSDGARMWDKPQQAAMVAAQKARVLGADPPPAVLPQDPEPRRIEDVPVHLDGDSLTVVPSQAMLTDPATVYPVSIDPGFNGGKEIWTHVSRKNPTKSYWSDSSTRGDMRVGQLWQGSSDDDWRTIVQFDVNKLKGATIKKAHVLVNVRHSASCSPTPFQLWRTNWVDKSAAVTWNSTKDKTWKVLGSVNATANKSACPKGNDEVRFAQTAVRDDFQNGARAGLGTITLAFRAKSESDDYQWKKLVPDSAYLDVEYNHTPGKPGSLAFSPCYAACSNGTAVTSSKRPTLSMKAADADGGTLRYEYEVYAADKTTRKASSGTTVTGVASNSQRGWTLKSDLADGQYYWRGKACDSYLCGSYSDWFGFKVDTANPKNPTVTSEKYPTTGWNGGPGVPGVFIFRPGTSTDAVKTYSYSLNGGTETQVSPPASGVLERTLTPSKDLVNTLRVKAIDTAGNVSGAVDYVFKVRPVGEAWYWSLDEGAGTAAASAPENNRPAAVSGAGVTWSEAGKRGESAATFAGAGELGTSSTVFDTLAPAGFTVAAWVRLPAPPATDESDPGTDPGSEPDPGTGDNPDEEQTPPDDEQADLPAPLPAGNQVAVSQDGVNTSMFKLGYRTDRDVDADGVNDPAWCFSVAAADVAAAATTDACTASYVEAGAWVHLVGIVNPALNRIQLYVNGIPTADGVLAEKAGTATWEATGRFAIGRGWNVGPSDRWVGEVDEVHATPRVWSKHEIAEKAQAEDLPAA
ncbi:LamG-like jellyroll fold domain-containing protein [Actinoplanes sp. NPDC049118]|uniref:LamG-like jellyroll fold domain-containing protein n=1 Tax=Actinoplanes sp. NPDC049118 TaxID=3155769 RepID=UPI0033D2B7E3